MKKIFALFLLTFALGAATVATKDLPTPCCYPCTPGQN
jgi:hypothetical protein